jgi:hypothetical protein
MSTAFPISLDEFKNFFLREAGIEYQPYPNWEEGKTYAAGDKVLHVVNFKVGVWESLEDDNDTEPSYKNEKWAIAEDEEEYIADWVLDADITRAMGEASFKYNPRLFTEEKGKMVFLYLTMFFLVYDRQMAASGANGNSAAGPVLHRTVGKMSVTYMQSTLYKSNPSYEFLSSNEYGKKAFALMSPYLRGGVHIMRGGSTGE